MGYVTNLMVNVGIIIVILFSVGIMLTDGNKLTNYENINNFKSINQTAQITSNLQNQTAKLEENIRNAQGSPDPTAQLLNLALNAGATAVIATFGFLGIAISLVYDFGNVLGIPNDITTITIVIIGFLTFAQISIALRTGRL